MPFSATWSALRSNLTLQTSIPNWTADKGLLGDSFTVSGVTPTHVEVDTPGAQNFQTIPDRDFEVVYDVWERYCNGTVPRHEIRDSTRFSKYVISILHWLEGHVGGALP